jgi:hypothetical protein
MFPLHSHADFFRDSRELGYTYDFFLSGPGDDGITPAQNHFPHTWAEAQLQAEHDADAHVFNDMLATADRLQRLKNTAAGHKDDHHTANKKTNVGHSHSHANGKSHQKANTPSTL